LANMLPLCSRHHHLVHEFGWRLDLHPDNRTLVITRPDGQVFATCRPDTAERRSPGTRKKPAA